MRTLVVFDDLVSQLLIASGKARELGGSGFSPAPYGYQPAPPEVTQEPQPAQQLDVGQVVIDAGRAAGADSTPVVNVPGTPPELATAIAEWNQLPDNLARKNYLQQGSAILGTNAGTYLVNAGLLSNADVNGLIDNWNSYDLGPKVQLQMP